MKFNPIYRQIFESLFSAGHLTGLEILRSVNSYRSSVGQYSIGWGDLYPALNRLQKSQYLEKYFVALPPGSSPLAARQSRYSLSISLSAYYSNIKNRNRVATRRLTVRS